MSSGFVHLRVHSEYSLADSIIKVKPLAATVAAREMGAVGAYGPGQSLRGSSSFYGACLSNGVKPLVGVDLTYTSSLCTQGVADVCRVGLLAMNDTGYKNLLKLVSAAYTDSEHRGQNSREQIFEHAEGLLVLCGAREGEVGKALLKGERDEAIRLAREWSAVFEDRFYLELVRTGRSEEARHVLASVSLAAELGLPVVATNDVCFLDADDFEAHETRVCIADGRVLDDPRRERRYSNEQYLKTSAEMAELFADIPEALTNTVEIARRCNVQIRPRRVFSAELSRA